MEDTKETKKEGCWRCGGDSVLTFSHDNGCTVLEKEECENCGDLR